MSVPSTLGEFFTFIGSAGAIGFVLSIVVENWGFFQTRNKQGKITILILIALLMGLSSYSLVRYVPAGVIEQAQPLYQVIVATLSILIASQVWHKTVNQQVIDVTAAVVPNTATRGQTANPDPARQGKG